MKKLIRLEETRAVRPRLAAWAVAAVAVVAATIRAGITAGQGNAAPAIEADKASHLHKKAEFKQPKLKHGVLTIKGTEASDKIALRPQAGEPGILQVDVGDDGSDNFSFERNEIAKIVVQAKAGDDLVRIDEGDGAFTDSDRNDDRRWRRQRRDRRRQGRRDAARRRRQRLHRRERRRRRREPRRRRRHVRLGPGRRQRHRRGPGRYRHDAVQRRQRRRAGRPVGEW